MWFWIAIYVSFNKTVLFLIYQCGGRVPNLILVKMIPKISGFEQMVKISWVCVGGKEDNISVLFYTNIQHDIIMHSTY